MKSVALVKLLRAVTEDSNNPKFSYEVQTHTMNGGIRTEVIHSSVKDRDYCKELKMKEGYKCAVRELNSYKWTIISEQEYSDMLTDWNKE